MKMFKLVKEHWPLVITFGYFVGLGIEGLLIQLNIDALEIHYRLFIIIGLSVLTFGGLILTMFSKTTILILLVALNSIYYGRRYFYRKIK